MQDENGGDLHMKADVKALADAKHDTLSNALSRGFMGQLQEQTGGVQVIQQSGNELL